MHNDLGKLLDGLTARALQRKPLTHEEGMALLATEDEDLLDVVAAAGRVRRHFFGNRVKLNVIVNMKSGLCPEDCAYCSQRNGSGAEVLKYNWIDAATAADTVGLAVAQGAKRICLVASGRRPSERDIGKIVATVATVRDRHPGIEVCTSLGLIASSQAEQLRDAGVHAYNHNLNTSRDRYAEICTTHTYEDRVDTVQLAARAGLSPCSGAIFGMGETDHEVVQLALDLRRLDPDSVPVNFLIPFEGTPMGGHWQLDPRRCLRILALFRFVFPDVEVRIAGGREIHLRSLQPLALHLANSIFLGDYLTSEGQAGSDDLRMISDAGFVIEGCEGEPLPNERRDLVTVRHRGPGTDLPANA